MGRVLLSHGSRVTFGVIGIFDLLGEQAEAATVVSMTSQRFDLKVKKILRYRRHYCWCVRREFSLIGTLLSAVAGPDLIVEVLVEDDPRSWDLTPTPCLSHGRLRKES